MKITKNVYVGRILQDHCARTHVSYCLSLTLTSIKSMLSLLMYAINEIFTGRHIVFRKKNIVTKTRTLERRVCAIEKFRKHRNELELIKNIVIFYCILFYYFLRLDEPMRQSLKTEIMSLSF